MFRELRFAMRRLGKAPGFALMAVLTLALGIGANTAIFSVVNGVLLKPLRFPAPQELMAIQERITTPQKGVEKLPVNANHFAYWREHGKTFADMAALITDSKPLGGGVPEEIGVVEQTANLFTVLGVRLQLGRTFTHVEEQPGHGDVVILTDGLWRRRFAADSAILGRSIVLDGKPYRVVGVLPANLAMPDSNAAEAFVPFQWTADVLQETEGDHNYVAIGRLKPGAGAVQAAGDLNSMQHTISLTTPDKVNLSALVTPLTEHVVGGSRRSLVLLLAAVGAVFLIACVNITNLLLTRAVGGGQEAAVRSALGATRRQLIWGALAEPFLLAGVGGALGVMVAMLAVPVLLGSAPADMPRLMDVQIDWVTLAFAAGVSCIAAALCGAAPAWHYSRLDPQRAMGTKTRWMSESQAGKRLRSGLIVGQVAASVALVITAGVFVMSIVKLLDVDRGFQGAHVVTANVVLPDRQYGDHKVRSDFYQRVLRQVKQIPGVEAAGAVSVLPLAGDNWGDLISRIGDNRPLFERPGAHFRWNTPGYFETLQIPLIAGRYWGEQDRGKNVAVVSKQVAEAVWPRQTAIGQIFRRGDPDEKPFEVVGVVGNVRSIDLSEPFPNMVYVPDWYRNRETASIVARTSQDPRALIPELRKAIWSVDAEVPVPLTRTMETVVDGSVAARRFEMYLLIGFAGTALLLASLGIYGVVSYSAAQRTREIGIRMALGAGIGNVYSLILREGVMPVVAGTILGVGLAWIAGRFLSAMLFQVSVSDPLINGLASGLLIVVGVAACLLPAARAANTEPLEALRYE